MNLPLPKIDHTTFKVTIPSTNDVIRFRPFTVKEEKLMLLMASNAPKDGSPSSAFAQEAMETINQVISNCMIDPSPVEFTLFDLEWIFLNLRKFSVGETIELSMVKDKIEYTGVLNLNDVEVVTNSEHTKKIMLTSEVGVVMKYPSFKTSLNVDQGNEVKAMMDMFGSCIESIFDAENVYPTNDYSKDDIQTFIESLPSDAFIKISKFFETMPKIKHDVVLKSSSGEEQKFTLEGLSDFF